MSKPIVILIPAYHCEGTIAETIESVQRQGPRLAEIREVVIADDGSHDRAAEIARRMWDAPVPLRILEREFNCGEYASVNNAVEQLPEDTEWFLIMHGDNAAKPGWLDAFLDRIHQATPDVGLIGSSYDYLTTGGGVRPGEQDSSGQVVTVAGNEAAVANALRRGCWWHISACAIRVAAYRRVGGLPKIMQLAGDWDFMLRILQDGWTIEHMPRSLMLYRENPSGSSSVTFRRHMDVWEMLTVVGRFHSHLGGTTMLWLHARYVGFLLRRAVRCVLTRDVVRLFWLFPAFGFIVASYVTCVLDRRPKAAIATRRTLKEQVA